MNKMCRKIIICLLLVYTSSCVNNQKKEAYHIPKTIFSANQPIRNDWLRKEIPFIKKGELIVFGNKETVAIVGRKEILFSANNGRNWESIKGGRGEVFYTKDSGKTYEKNYSAKNRGKISVDVESLCSVEDATFHRSKRLYIFSLCEHSTQIWSIPIINNLEPWYVTNFISNDNYESENKYYGPYKNIISVGENVFLDAILPNGSSLLAIQDNGKTLTKVWQVEKNSRIVDIDFFNKEVWILLSSGEIIKTIDEGNNWKPLTKLPANVIGKITSLDFVNSEFGFAVGENGLILKTENGGQSWINQMSNTTNFLNKVVLANKNKAWVIGEQGTVLETTDGGINWKNISSYFEYDSNEIDIHNIAVKDGKAWIIINNFIYVSH